MMNRIFVQIASYRDTECQATIDDLIAKAAHPELIAVGVVQQDVASAPDIHAPAVLGGERLRVLRFDAQLSEGTCWARNIVQTLWRGEEYTLCIDSHMRFVQDWDVQITDQLNECPSPDAVLTHRPAAYYLPDTRDESAMPTYMRALNAGTVGDLTIVATQLTALPPQPLPGAFVAAGFLFARSSLIRRVPYDPQMYFDFEELSLALRLFTHGFDIYSPRSVIAYHYFYDTNASTHPYLRHWDDNANWQACRQRGKQRYIELVQSASYDAKCDPVQSHFGLGTVRTLAEFEAHSGLDLQSHRATPRAVDAAFIPDLASYTGNATVTQQNVTTIVTFVDAVLKKNKPVFDVLPDTRFERSAIVHGAPPGVLIMRNYIDAAACRFIKDYADRQAFQALGTIDHLAADTQKPSITEARITDSIYIDGIACEIVNIFNDIYCNRLSPYFGVLFERYERPSILRYPPGGRYFSHADADNFDAQTQSWVRVHRRDYSVLLYLNDEYEGGELEFTDAHYSFKPEPGMLVAFPSDSRYRHAALPTTSGIRYAIVSWGRVIGSAPAAIDYPCSYIDIMQRAM